MGARVRRSSAKKRESEESLVAVTAVVNHAPSVKKRKSNEAKPASVEYRDVYVKYSPSLNKNVVSLRDVSDGAVYRIAPESLAHGPLTRLHFQNTAGEMKFSEYFKRSIDQLYVTLYLQESKKHPIAVQLAELWCLLNSFPDGITKVVVRLADPDELLLLKGERIAESMIYDDALFFDAGKVLQLCRAFDHVELHVKCNAIQAEDVPQLIEFLAFFPRRRRLLIYVSEFVLFLAANAVTQTDGRFRSTNDKVKVTQVGPLVIVKIGAVRIQFEDEFRALEFRNYE